MSDTNTNKVLKSDTTDVEIETEESVYKTTHTAVRKARRFAVQGIYEWLMTDRRFEQNGHNDWKSNAPHDIAARTRATNAMHTVHLGYYHEMMRDIPKQIDELDKLIASQLDREVNRLDMIEHAILLIGTYEFKHSLHIPYKVVLDEAMKLNTHFGGTDGHKLINAVLDRLAKKLRIDEVNVDKGLEAKNLSNKQPNKQQPSHESRHEPSQTATVNHDTGNDMNDKVTQLAKEDKAETLKANAKPRISLKNTVKSEEKTAIKTESSPETDDLNQTDL